MRLDLDHKVALITGAASGIGFAIAQRFVEAAGRVVIADINLDDAEALARDLGGDATAIAAQMDVADEEAVNEGVAKAVATYGTVDILVSNAGIQSVHPVEDFPYAEWRKMLSTHLDGAFLTSKACLPHMYKQKSGSVIFMGSVHSVEASPLNAGHVTAKHGLLGLARVIAKEGAPHGVRANLVCPGFVKTPLAERQILEQAAALGISEEEVVEKLMLSQTVDKEFTTVEDVAEIALLFAAFPSAALTGQSLLVSHGWHMH